MKLQSKMKKRQSQLPNREFKRVENEMSNEDTHIVRLRMLVPPSFNAVRKERTWRRFTNTSTLANLAFTLANGHSQFLVVTAVTGAAVPYVDSWRIRTIRLFVQGTTNASVFNQASFSLTPTGSDNSSNNFNDPEQIFQVECLSQAFPGHALIHVGRRSPMGGWHFTNNVNIAGTLFQYNLVTSGAPAQTVVMDIEFETVTNLVGLPLGYGVVTATTTLGTVGARPIAGFSPIGINNLG